MTEIEPRSVDPNTADVEALSQIPGIKVAMARRIVNARPFERPEDLTKVRGIGPNVLERLRPYLTLPPSAGDTMEEGAIAEPPVEAEALADLSAAEVEPVPEIPPEPVAAESGTAAQAEGAAEAAVLESTTYEEEVSTPMDLVEAKAPSVDVEEHEPVVPTETRAEKAPPDEAMPPPPRRPGMAPGHVRWLAAVSGLLALSLALVLSLGILATLNDGQLQFVKPSQLSELAVRVEGIDAQASDLRQDIAGLRTRLNNLEALSGRLDAVEQTADGLRTDLDATTSQAEELSKQVNALETDLSSLTQQLDDVEAEVETLRTQSDHFQSFLDGLRDLMQTLFPSEGGTP